MKALRYRGAFFFLLSSQSLISDMKWTNNEVNNSDLLIKSIVQQSEKEESAILICRGQLGVCHILHEIIDYFCIDVKEEAKKKKWYKIEVKKGVSMCHEKVQKVISQSKTSSETKSDILYSISDKVQEIVSVDVFKLWNGTSNDIRGWVKNQEDKVAIAKLLTLNALISLNMSEYQRITTYMKEKVYPANYDSSVGYINGEALLYWLNYSLERLSHLFTIEDLDLNKIPSLVNGSIIILRKIDKLMGSDLRKETLEEDGIEDSKEDIELYNQALKELNL